MADIIDRNSQIEVVRDLNNSTFYNKTGVAVRVRNDKLEILNTTSNNQVLEQFGVVELPDVVGNTIIQKAETVRTFIVTVVPEDVNVSSDMQTVSATDSQVTTSTSFVDIPTMTLSTKNLGESGAYNVQAMVSVSGSANNTVISIIINVDGADTTVSEGIVELDSAGVAETICSFDFQTGLLSGKEVKLRWKTSTGTATITNRQLIISGAPETTIVD